MKSKRLKPENCYQVDIWPMDKDGNVLSKGHAGIDMQERVEIGRAHV